MLITVLYVLFLLSWQKVLSAFGEDLQGGWQGGVYKTLKIFTFMYAH